MRKLKFTIGDKIKAARIAQGYSQEQFAEMLGLTRASVINLESDRHHPTLDGFYIICCILQLQPSEMFPPLKQVQLKSRNKTIIKKTVRKTFKIVNL
jgi:transcriptional regulator with XRE-family HTH domain